MCRQSTLIRAFRLGKLRLALPVKKVTTIGFKRRLSEVVLSCAKNEDGQDYKIS